MRIKKQRGTICYQNGEPWVVYMAARRLRLFCQATMGSSPFLDPLITSITSWNCACVLYVCVCVCACVRCWCNTRVGNSGRGLGLDTPGHQFPFQPGLLEPNRPRWYYCSSLTDAGKKGHFRIRRGGGGYAGRLSTAVCLVTPKRLQSGGEGKGIQRTLKPSKRVSHAKRRGNKYQVPYAKTY